MGQLFSKTVCVLTFVVMKAREAAAAIWQTAMAGRAEGYRPEAHYFRGPGPKWRAKYGRSAPIDRCIN